MSWIALWLFSEGSGTTVADSAASPLNLSITDGGASAWASIAQGDGYDINAQTGTVVGADASAKIQGLTGLKVGTLEFVYQFAAEAAGQFFAVSDSAFDLEIGTWENGNTLRAFFTGVAAEYTWTLFFDTENATTVGHVRFDSDLGTGLRMRAFRDGVDFGAGTVVGEVGAAATMSIGGSHHVRFGTHNTGDNPVDATFFEGAIADHKAADSEIADRTAALALDNDTDPAGIPPVLVTLDPADNATGVSRTANIALTFDQNVTAGSGNINIWNGTRGVLFESIPISDGRVSISTTTVTVNPSGTFEYGADHYVLIASGVIRASDDNTPWGGITSPATWNFRVVELTTAGLFGGLVVGSSTSRVGVARVGAAGSTVIALPSMVGGGF